MRCSLLTPDMLARALLRGTKARYDKGWAPGPNAFWKKIGNPDQMAKSLQSKGKSPEKPRESSASTSTVQGGTVEPKSTGIDSSSNKANPEKPKRIRDRANEHSTSLREIVKKHGGINMGSLEKLGYDVNALKESGLAWRGLFKREGGKDAEQIVSALHNEGHIQVPGMEGAGGGAHSQKQLPTHGVQHVLDGLVSKAKSLHANDQNKLDKQYADYLKETQNAERYHAAAGIAEAIRSGEAAGSNEDEAQNSLDDDLGMAGEEGGGEAGDFNFGALEGKEEPIPYQHAARYEADAQGNEHKPAGEGGGQFTGKAEHGQAPDDMAGKLKQGSLFDAPEKKAPDELKLPEQKQELKATPKEIKQSMKSPDELANAVSTKLSDAEVKSYLGALPMNGAGGHQFYAPAFHAALQMGVKPNSQQFDDYAQQANMAIFQKAKNFRPLPNDPEGNRKLFGEYANRIAASAVMDMKRKEGSLKRGGQENVGTLDTGMDVEQKKQSEYGNDLRDAIAKLPEAEQRAIQGELDGKTVGEFAAESGMNATAVHRLRVAARARLKQMVSADYYQKLEEKIRYAQRGQKWRYMHPDEFVRTLKTEREKSRYIHGPMLPEVWAEVLRQSHQYANLAPEFVRAVMDAMQHSESQWDAINQGRVAFLSHGSQRYEKEPAKESMTPEKLAELFHNTYERLAPSFDYKTREESAKPWADVPENNKKLMIAVCAEIKKALGDEPSERYEYGPRHQPPKRIEGAVARLEALRDYAAEIDEEKLADEVESIAREFSADDLKEVARGLGIERGLESKYNVLRLILAKVCKEK